MNILVFSWRDLKHPLAGGAEQVMHEHMKGWLKAGHSVTFLASFINNLPSEETIDGVKIIRDGHQYLGVQIKAFLYYLQNKNKFDLVVDQFHGLPFFTPLYVKKPKLAVLQEVAKEVWFKNPFMFPLNLAVGLIGYVLEPSIFWFYRNTDFMVGSNSAKDDLIKFGIKSKSITIVPHGVIVPSIIPKHQTSIPRIITYFGPLTADKGIMDALKTFSILNSLGDYNFSIIGRAETNSFYQKVMRRVDSLKLRRKVRFYNRPSDEEKFEILAKTYLFINPSIREGWGLVNIEANVVGTPVIAYPSQGLIDSVNDGVSGIITRKSTPEALANEIEKLTRDNGRYERLSYGAKKWATNFNWDRSKNMSLVLINKLCK